jgi:ACS family hexuronate transporter-like MFS transporter
VTAAIGAARYRWWILAVFVLSSAINYLDRQSLATLAPLLRADFHLSREQYGWILGAFSLTYAASAPFAGMLIDRTGLTRGISLAVGLWSCAGIATGFTTGLGGLIGCRAVLGVAEAGGIPSAGKAIHTYLRPPERALGNAINQAGVMLGAILAPPVATWIAVRYGWRMAFVLTGILGLLWIPVWNRVARHAAPSAKPSLGAGHGELLRDRRLWAFVAANGLGMVGYSLWSNWTTQYLVDVHRLTVAQAAWYAWIPPLVAMGGGFAGGWFSLRLMNRGMAAPAARFRVCFVAALLSLATAAIPRAPGAMWATAGISVSIFAVSAFSVSTYTLPLDVFGGARAAFAVSMLVASYGAIQLVISPLFGAIIDRHGYGPVTAIAAVTPLAACAALWSSGAVA